MSFKNFGLLWSDDEKFLTILGGLSVLAFGIGRGICASLGEKIGFKVCFTFTLVAQVSIAFTIPYIPHKQYAYMWWVLGAVFLLGG